MGHGCSGGYCSPCTPPPIREICYFFLRRNTFAALILIGVKPPAPSAIRHLPGMFITLFIETFRVACPVRTKSSFLQPLMNSYVSLYQYLCPVVPSLLVPISSQVLLWAAGPTYQTSKNPHLFAILFHMVEFNKLSTEGELIWLILFRYMKSNIMLAWEMLTFRRSWK